MDVKDMKLKDFQDLCKARAEWGHKKYGDADRFRDTAKDVSEEAADIVNICARRFKWIKESDLDRDTKLKIVSELHKIQNTAILLFLEIAEADILMKASGYLEPDEVERVWFDGKTI